YVPWTTVILFSPLLDSCSPIDRETWSSCLFPKKIPTIVSRQRIVPSGWVEMFASRRQWFSFYHGHSAALPLFCSPHHGSTPSNRRPSTNNRRRIL
ncbi:hypothetical protein TSPI_07491, partial [Trichinella spiralis]